MTTEFINPKQLGSTFGWSHVAVSRGQRTIYISGQVAVDENGQVVGVGDLRAQTEQAFRNVQIALEAAGATFAHVVKTSLFVVGLQPAHVPIIREVRARYVAAETPPTSTLVGVSALVGKDWLIEIEAIAVLP